MAKGDKVYKLRSFRPYLFVPMYGVTFVDGAYETTDGELAKILCQYDDVMLINE